MTVKNIDLSGRHRFILQKELIWKPEDSADSIFYAERGRVAIIELAKNGTEILHETAGENDFFRRNPFSANF